MNKSVFNYFIPILLLLSILSCTDENISENESTQDRISFVKTIGGTKNETAQSVIKTIDGGYAIAGFTQSNDLDVVGKLNESYDYWVVKFNVDNELQWSKNYGGKNDDRGQSIIQTIDGGFFITGFSKSNDGDIGTNFGSNDFWVAKLDIDGTILWEKSIGFSGTDQAFSAIQTSDAGYLIVGTLDVTASSQQGNDRSSLLKKHAGGDSWAVKLDANGTKQWRRYFGGSNTDTAYDVIETEDNGYLMIGLSDSNDIDISNSKGTYDFWIVKIDSKGALVWEKSYGGTEIDQAYSIAKTLNGNYIITGDSRSNTIDVNSNYGSADIWTIMINDVGEIIWKKNYGGSGFDTSNAVISSRNGGFYIVGNSRSSDNNLTSNKGNNDVWVLKIDDSGNIEWEKSIGGTEIDLGFDIAELDDGSVIIVGESWSSDNDIIENKGFSDMLIIRLNK